jgi:CubicO group peptidase (beta-lactamase class C family)
MQIIKALALLLTALAALAPASAEAQDRQALAPALDRFIERAMGRLEAMPGLSVAVVDDQGLIHAAGFGVADVETPVAVTVDTPFYIASSTKSFTALAIAAMDHRGELDLGAPISSWSTGSGVPTELALSLSLSDLLSHQSGVRNDAIAFRVAFSGDWTPEGLWGLTAETQPNPDAGHGRFEYTNAGYNLATVLMERRWGRDWRDMVRQEVLEPLALSRTTARIDALRASGVVIAGGHFADRPGPARRSPLQKTDSTMQSAGGLVSTASDMAVWLEAQINDGVVGGRRVFPEGLVASTHAARVDVDSRSGPYTRHGYGLGWYLGRYGDDLLIHHFGGFAGSRAHVSFMPDRGIGVVVMVNEDLAAGDLADLVANYAYDFAAGMRDIDAAYDARLDALVLQRDERRARLAAAAEERRQRPRTLTLPDAAYVGDYVSSALGRMIVLQTPNGLELSIGAMRATAEPATQPDALRVELTPFQGQVAQFEVSNQRAEALTLAGYRFLRE